MTREQAGADRAGQGLGWPNLDVDDAPSTQASVGDVAPGTGLGWPTLGDGMHPEDEEARP